MLHTNGCASIAYKGDYFFIGIVNTGSHTASKSNSSAMKSVNGMRQKVFIDNTVATNIGNKDNIKWVEVHFL